MKRKWMVITAMLCVAGAANGADGPINADLMKSAVSFLEPGPTVQYHTQTPQQRPLTIGKDVEVAGPLVDTFRSSPKRWDEMNGWEKASSIPILSLVVPQKMPTAPTQKSRYFAWGQSDRAWADLADHVIPGPQTALISASGSK